MVSFNEGVLVGKTLLHSVLVSSVKGDTLCDFECGTSDVARAQVGDQIPHAVCLRKSKRNAVLCKAVWQRLQMRCGAGCLKAHSDNDLAAVSQPFVRCYAKVIRNLVCLAQVVASFYLFFFFKTRLTFYESERE